MQNGEFIIDRWMVECIAAICRDNNYDFHTYSDDWILEIKSAQKTGWVVGYKFGINNSASANLAQDKVAGYEILTSHGIAAVPHFLMRTKVGSRDMSIDGEVVLKPLIGTSGHMVKRFDSSKNAALFAKTSSVEAWTISPFVELTKETRLIVLNGTVLLAYEKQNPVNNNGLPMFNLGKGATPRDISPDKEMQSLAVTAANALGLRVCAVDIVEDKSGERKVLEVNDGIMMEYYSRYSKSNVTKSHKVYQKIITSMMGEII